MFHCNCPVGIELQVTDSEDQLIGHYFMQLDSKPKENVTSPYFRLTSQAFHTVTIEAEGKNLNTKKYFNSIE